MALVSARSVISRRSSAISPPYSSTRMGSVIHVATVFVLMTACSPTPESASSSTSSTASGLAGAPETSRQRVPPTVSAKVELSKASAPQGEPVTIRLVLRNDGARDAELSVVGSLEQRFDVIVLDSAGREVWSRLHLQDIDLGRNVLPMRAGDSLVFAERWNQRDNGGRLVSPGWYEVRGHLSPRSGGDSTIASARLHVCARARDC